MWIGLRWNLDKMCCWFKCSMNSAWPMESKENSEQLVILNLSGRSQIGLRTFKTDHCGKFQNILQNRPLKANRKCNRHYMLVIMTVFLTDHSHLILRSACHHPAYFNSNSICAIKSMISLEIKCPQLSKPETIAARNQNSIGDRMEKKTLGETRLSRGSVLLWPDKTSSSVTFRFRFMHLADAFIQSDLQCIQAIHVLSLCVFPGNRTHNLLRC